MLVISWEQDSSSCDLLPAKRKCFMEKKEPWMVTWKLPPAKGQAAQSVGPVGVTPGSMRGASDSSPFI